MLLVPGDANGDFVADQRDVVRMLQAGKYRAGEAANWGEGDYNGDSVVDQLDVIAVLQAGNYLRGSYADDAVSVDQLLADLGR